MLSRIAIDHHQVAAGVVIVKDDGIDQLTLLLHDPSTGLWGPPKGLMEPGEDRISCAIREVREETGISLSIENILVGEEYVISYCIDGHTLKTVYLYSSINLPKTIACKLSTEHNDFRWVRIDQLSEYVAHDNLRYVLHEIIKKNAVHKKMQKIKNRLRHQILETLPKIISNRSQDTVDWYIAGSFAANEESWNLNEGLTSDIDLVAYSESGVRANTLRRILGAVSNELKTILGITEHLNLSVYLVTPASRLNSTIPFWSYYRNFALPINNAQIDNVIRKFVAEPSDYSYNCFRLLWYCYLDKFINGASHLQGYNFTKFIVLGAVITWIKDGGKFEGYRMLRASLLSHYQNKIYSNEGHTKDNEVIRWMILALERKIFGDFGSTDHSSCNNDIFVDMLRHLEHGLINYSNIDSKVLSCFLIKLMRGSNAGNITGYEEVAAFLRDNNHPILNIIDLPKDQHSIITALALYRLLRWPNEVRCSIWRYEMLAEHLNDVVRHTSEPSELLQEYNRIVGELAVSY